MTEKRAKELFKKLSKPLTCGEIIYGKRYQKSGGEWSSERIFILEDDINKDEPTILYRSYFNTDASWRKAIHNLLMSERAFKLPKPKIYCLEEDMITYRSISFDLNFLKD